MTQLGRLHPFLRRGRVVRFNFFVVATVVVGSPGLESWLCNFFSPELVSLSYRIAKEPSY